MLTAVSVSALIWPPLVSHPAILPSSIDGGHKYLLSSHHPDIFLCSLNFLVDANMVNLIFFDMVRESTCGHVDPFIRKDAFCY